jgi:hypothetical protein
MLLPDGGNRIPDTDCPGARRLLHGCRLIAWSPEPDAWRPAPGYRTVNSILRLRALPSAVSLDATGRDSPYPEVVRVEAATPRLTR